MIVAVRTWASWAVVLLPVLTAPAEPVSLRPHWTVGDERRYELGATYRQTTADEQGKDAERIITQSAHLLLQVKEVDASGGATVQLTFESLHAELTQPGGGTGEVFDLKPPIEGEPAPEGEGTPLSHLLGGLADCTIVAAIQPDGSVATLTGLVPLAKALQEQQGDTTALQGMGFFSPPRLKSNLAMLWRVDPERRPRDPGAAWKTTEHLALGKGYEADATTAWTLSTLDGTTAKIAGVITILPSPSKRETDPAAPRLAIKDQQGTISIEWDTVIGAPIHITEDRSATWTATVDLGPGAATPQVAAESKAASNLEIRLVK